MAPPRNLRRRAALADAAIEILGTAGSHALSHRAVDEQARLPAGTASNYFPSRGSLLEAAARRILELHLADMHAASDQLSGPLDAAGLAGLLGAGLRRAATQQRTRYLAVYALSLEATRRPGLAQVLAELDGGALEVTVAQHRALGLETSPAQAQALITLYGGVLLRLVTGPPEAVTPEATLTLARCLVAGVLSAVPGLS